MTKKDLCHFIILALLGVWGLNNISFIYETNKTPKLISSAIEDKNYAKNIKIQLYLMTPEQVSVLFKTNPDGEPERWVYQEKVFLGPGSYQPYLKPLFLVVRLKNEGELFAWGQITYTTLTNRHRKIQILPLSPKMTHFANYVVTGHMSGISLQKIGEPTLSAQWYDLYVQK